MQPLRPRMSFNLVLLVADHQSISLRRHPLQLALTSGLGLGTLGVHLVLQSLLTLLLGLGTVDLKEDNTLIHHGTLATPGFCCPSRNWMG